MPTKIFLPILIVSTMLFLGCEHHKAKKSTNNDKDAQTGSEIVDSSKSAQTQAGEQADDNEALARETARKAKEDLENMRQMARDRMNK